MNPRRPFVATALALASVLGLSVSAPAGEAETPTVELERAEMEVERLEDALRSGHSVNDELLGDLNAVSRAYVYLEGPPELELVPIPEDATEEERASIEDENRDREREWKRTKRRWSRAAERFREDAEDAILDALGLVKLDRRTETNIREPVNILAARVLAATRNPDLARQIQRVIEREIIDAKHTPSAELLREVFKGLARLGNIETLEWLLDEFTHTRSTPQVAVDQLRAAQEAILLFSPEQVPGELRYEIVELYIRTFAGVEALAVQRSADTAAVRAKIFWDQIRNNVIRILQRFSGTPTDATGVSLATVEQFQTWFREHKNPHKAPWTDPEE